MSTGVRGDPITRHVAALERALHGPHRTRRGMIAEARAGLLDAAEAYQAGGLPPEQAAARAVRDFGAVGEVAPAFQAELTARQGRWSALLFALVFPGLLAGWDLLWASGLVRREPVVADELVKTLARLQDMATVVIAVTAVTLLAVTFRRDLSPHRVTWAIGLTGTAGAATCGGLTVLMSLAGGRSTTTLLTTNPTAVTAFAVSGMMLFLIVWQSVRSLHLARQSPSAAPMR